MDSALLNPDSRILMHRKDHRGLSPPPAEGWNVPNPEKRVPVVSESGMFKFVIGWL